MIHVPVDDVRDLLLRLLVSKCLFKFDAETVAQRLIDADLRGLPEYGAASALTLLEALAAGDIDPRGRVLTVHETAAVAVLDGSRAAGAVAATKGMESAIAKANGVGVGTAVVGNSQSLGAASVFALLAAREGLIGFVTSSSGQASVAAYGSNRPAVGNHPLAWAIPVPGRPPFVLDFSTGATSWSDVRAAAVDGRPLDAGLALDAEGRPTTDAVAATTLLPMAGPRGFGLAFVCSVLCGGLAGGRLPIRRKRPGAAEDSQHFFQAIQPAEFIDPADFAKRVTAEMDDIRGLPPLPGFDRVRLAGDEDAARADRIRSEGIPLRDSVHAALGQATPGGWTRGAPTPPPRCDAP
ncbi:MAG: Ldh family oxidoreductase [Planctomyces sp.]|nr:Ldh family oxidoreductase [Planctomyces sp.]